MKLKLVYVNTFDSEFKDNTYYIYQFVDPQTLSILNYSVSASESSALLNKLDTLVIGNAYQCTITIKKNKLSICSIDL